MINLIPTKFEVSTFSRYGDMKCVKMHKIGVVWGGKGSPLVDFVLLASKWSIGLVLAAALIN